MHLPKWQFITQEKDPMRLLQQIHDFSSWGCPWIQLRMKNTSNDVIVSTAFKAKEICQAYNTRLSINDHVHIAQQVNADGLHLGKNDMTVADARKIVGKHMIIGATANTFKDIEKLAMQELQYIGLGPFAFTKTKSSLSPILGLQGYEVILTKMKENNIHIPVYAVGGIELSDISSIFDLGVHGIAVSGMLHNAKDPQAIISLLNQRSYA